MNKSFILKMTKVCGFLFGYGAEGEGVFCAPPRTWGGSGGLESQSRVVVDGPILSQVMEPCFQARGTSRPCCSCKEHSRGRVFKTVRMLQVPSLHCCRHRSCEEGSGFKLQGECEVLAGHWTACLWFWFCSIVARKAVQGSL